MPEPKKRQTKGSQGSRRAHLKLKPINLAPCSHCKKLKLPHRMCTSCGYYNDREVVNVLEKELKKKEKEKEKRKKE